MGGIEGEGEWKEREEKRGREEKGSRERKGEGSERSGKGREGEEKVEWVMAKTLVVL